MEIRNGLESLNSLLGVNATDGPAGHARNPTAAVGGLGTDRATLSSAASEMAQRIDDGGVRGEKVAAIQGALASGTYSVPASAVATKVVDSMPGVLR